MQIRIPTKITPQEAIKLQMRLAPLVTETGESLENIETVVGCDASYVGETTIAAAIAVNYDDLTVQQTKLYSKDTFFPYIPGLLSFREGPAVIRAIRALRPASYVCVVDGHGLAHPRRFGLACFVGLLLDNPTIGVAKSLLYGFVEADHVVDRDGSRIAELITLPGTGKVIFVSVGHKISLNDAVEVVQRCLTPQGPLPIKLAHEEVTKRKWEIRKSHPVSS